MTSLLRRLINRRLLKAVALVAAGALVFGGSAAAVRLTSDEIAIGDRVTYHVYAYRESDGALVYTTDGGRAHEEAANGNELLQPLIDLDSFGALRQTVALSNKSMDVMRLVVGYRAGDVVHTPHIVNPWGSAADWDRVVLPRQVGPIPTEFTIDLEDAYGNESKSWFKEEVPREDLRPGEVVPYIGGTRATVLRVSEETATLRLLVDDNTPEMVRSIGLDIPFRVEALSANELLLHVALSAGEVFETKGCEVPGFSLASGNYLVEEVGPDTVTVREHPAEATRALVDQTAKLEFHILDVEKGPAVKLAKVAALVNIFD